MQQPLATVVIGGMISATLLTLFVLPILYKWVENRSAKMAVPKPITALLLIGGISFFASGELKAQDVKGKTINHIGASY